MPVDEFGREIPGRTNTHSGNNSNSRSPGIGANNNNSAATTSSQLDSPLQAGRGRSGSGTLDRKRAASDTDQHSHHHNNPNSSRSGGGPANNNSNNSPAPVPRSRNKNHPSHKYIDDPLLCQVLWKEEQKVLKPLEQSSAADNNIDNDDNDIDNIDNIDANNNDTEDSIITAQYDAYKKGYCLNYIRSFFNKHLDDSWFRVRYSPAVRLEAVNQEKMRALQEVKAMQAAMKQNVQEFLVTVRLGGGGINKAAAQIMATSIRKPTTTTTANTNTTTDSSTTNAAAAAAETTPTAHLFSFQQQQPPAAWHISDILPHVTDQQLLLALADQTDLIKKVTDLNLVRASAISVGLNTFLQRDAVVTGPAAAISDVLRALHTKKQQQQQQQHHNHGSSSSSNRVRDDVPRKDVPRKGDAAATDNSAPVLLDVECSEPYGRTEYDADGLGGAPADGLAVPVRKSVVTVSALAPHNHTASGSGSNQHNRRSKSVTVTLSAALSSTSRLEGDRKSATALAHALDRKTSMPVGSRLEDLLAQNNPNNDWTVADQLDVAICYLRRVHLISFYHGCVAAAATGDVVTGKSPVSTIHLRLHNADEILKESSLATAAIPSSGEQQQQQEHAPKDLLVQRLEDSIAKALALQESETTDTTGGLVDADTTEQDAAAIQQAETGVKKKWLDDHAITDADGRARCSFAFCHKLFKDSIFLHKHLLKKHVEFLRAEQAKCHDEYMMKAWDCAKNRPVPDILIDCGARFGTVATPVLPGREPDCVDPEPELWRREEERRLRDSEMRARQHEGRNQQQQQQQQQERPRPSQQHTFVDVDDMKEEKVELSFDNVEVPDVSAVLKKKKKKRKLL